MQFMYHNLTPCQAEILHQLMENQKVDVAAIKQRWKFSNEIILKNIEFVGDLLRKYDTSELGVRSILGNKVKDQVTGFKAKTVALIEVRREDGEEDILEISWDGQRFVLSGMQPERFISASDDALDLSGFLSSHQGSRLFPHQVWNYYA